jgi:hypothetical protein
VWHTARRLHQQDGRAKGRVDIRSTARGRDLARVMRRLLRTMTPTIMRIATCVNTGNEVGRRRVCCRNVLISMFVLPLSTIGSSGLDRAGTVRQSAVSRQIQGLNVRPTAGSLHASSVDAGDGMAVQRSPREVAEALSPHMRKTTHERVPSEIEQVPSVSRIRNSELGEKVASSVKAGENIPDDRRLHGMVSVGGKLYLFGGEFEDSTGTKRFFDDLWSFEPQKGQMGVWTRLSPLGSTPSKRSHHVLIPQPRTGPAGSFLLLGGKGDTEIERGCCKKVKYLTDMWSYDIHSKAWHKLSDGSDLKWGFDVSNCAPSDGTVSSCEPEEIGPPMDHNRFVYAGDTKIFSFGGWRMGKGNSDETWVLTRTNVSSSDWKFQQLELASPGTKPLARHGHDMTFVNSSTVSSEQAQGILVLFGGLHLNSPRQYLGDTWVMSISGQTWEQCELSPSPESRWHHCMTTHDHHVYLHGGASDTLVYNDVWRFDVVEKKWRKINMPADAVLNNRYMFAMASVVASSAKEWLFVHGGMRETNNFIASSEQLWRINVSHLSAALLSCAFILSLLFEEYPLSSHDCDACARECEYTFIWECVWSVVCHLLLFVFVNACIHIQRRVRI